MSPLMLSFYVLIPFVVVVAIPWIIYTILGLFL